MTWKYLQLSPAARRLARIPRFGRLMARLPESEFDELHSPGQVYWKLYSRMPTPGDSSEGGLFFTGLAGKAGQEIGVVSGTKPTIDRRYRQWQIECCFAMAGALAYCMTARKEKPEDFADDVGQLKQDVIDLLITWGPKKTISSVPISETDWYNWLVEFFKMDSHDLRCITFSSGDADRIVWADISVRAFFAACWACRWASPDQLKTTWSWIPHAVRVKAEYEWEERARDNNQDYVEFWRMAIDLPLDRKDSLDKPWFPLQKDLLASLFDGNPRDKKRQPIRSSELLVKAFPLMRGTEAMKTFLSEFEDIVSGQKGPEKQRVAQRLLFDVDGQYDAKGVSHFLSLCEGRGGPEDDGTFEMGSEASEGGDSDERPVHLVKLTPYRLHRCCVTNAEYELFDSRHRALRDFTKDVDELALDRHPVVSVSSWDGLAFGLWLGERKIAAKRHRFTLPTEAQWEYACRCKKVMPFTWGDNEYGVQRDGNRVESSYCNFDGNYPWALSGTAKAQKGQNLKRTIRVDGLGETGIHISANPWGYYQMHGNVWEWCRDWYDDRFYESDEALKEDPENTAMASNRVLRGGSGINGGRFCRSAHRVWDSPGNRYWNNSCRLVAVPVE